MSDLSNRLRDRASELSDVGFFATGHEMRQAADLIDQQAAEITDLKLRLNRWNSGDNSIGAKEQVKRIMHERDEWRRRAGVMRTWLESWDQWLPDFEGATEGEPYFLISFPEAAQWFEEES